MAAALELTPELADRICGEISEGRSLRSVCREDWAPAASTVFKWFRERPDFAEQYARAKEASADALADEILEIADDGTNDWMERESQRGTFIALNDEAIQRSRLRVDTRKWIASKLKPKKYGEKIDVEHGGEIAHAVQVYIPANGRNDKPSS